LQKAQKIFLEVAEDNHAAFAFYTKTGFVITGKRAGYYKRIGGAVDALMLELVL
jgi:ribosomal-protein-alanine N-acetyltransferase